MLRAGDWVQVRSEQEILGTLDLEGKLDGMPFMPEMLKFCGQRVRVFRRANKACDTLATYKSRRLTDTVHLENSRCDGCSHGGCQAGCLMFWKEAWLKRVDDDAPAAPALRTNGGRADLEAQTQRPDPEVPGEHVYVCQATELLKASTPLPWWDPRQYLRELWSGNVSLQTFVRSLGRAWYNALRRFGGGVGHPHVEGTLTKTPTAKLGLELGERVRVRPLPDILATLDTLRRNRGLSFDVEMVRYCEREFTVLRRVKRIVNERTGKMMDLPGDCLVLDGVVCSGCVSRDRLFCPRSIYPFWREIWLERVTS